MKIVLTAKQFYILYKDDWIKAVEYLTSILKNEFYKNFGFQLFEDFILANNYLNSVNKVMDLIRIYKLLSEKYKVDKEYLKSLDIEKLVSILLFLSEKNYKDWFQKIETLSTIKFNRLVEQKCLEQNMGRFTSLIAQLNVLIVDFNELVWQIKGLKSYWHKLPIVNKKVFIKLFKENLSIIYNVYEGLKEK